MASTFNEVFKVLIKQSGPDFMSSAKITYNKRSIKMYLHKFLKTPTHNNILVPFILLVLKTQITKPHFTLDTKTFLIGRLYHVP